MDDLLKLIVTAIVSQPKKLSIAKDQTDSAVTFTVKASQEDIGKIIGKSGKTIKAIRAILKIVAEQQHQWVNIEVEEA